MLWSGAPDPRAVLRRRLRAAGVAVAWQLGALAFALLGFVVIGAAEALPSLVPVLAFFYVGVALLLHGRSTFGAVRAARRTRIELTREYLVIEQGDRRHERRLASLSLLRLSMESADVGSIHYELPRPPIPQWLLAVAGAPETDLLVESVPGAQRLFALLEAQRGRARADEPAAEAGAPAAGSEATAASVVAGAAPWRPRTTAPLPARVWRGLARMPWWIGAPFFLMGLLFAIMVVVIGLGGGSPTTPGELVLILAMPVAFALLGAAILVARTQAFVTRRRLRSSGQRAMAEVVGLADAHFEINDVSQWVVRYRYRAGGLEHEGESPMMPRGDAGRWSPGDRVMIAYDPARPESSTWLGDALVLD